MECSPGVSFIGLVREPLLSLPSGVHSKLNLAPPRVPRDLMTLNCPPAGHSPLAPPLW